MPAPLPVVLVLNGPNLNLLGQREPEYYGTTALDEIERGMHTLAPGLGVRVECVQSNAEHVLIERIHQALADAVAFVVINPAAFTHTSVALRDALAASRIPFIEVHLSNIYAREAFRQHSYFSDLAIGVISGLGPHGYDLALRAAAQYLKSR